MEIMGLPKNSGIDLHPRYKTGKMNLITDVPGIKVGHKTVKGEGNVNTGVTVILPHSGDVFHDKVMAATSVINGFGKSVGLVQIDELGTIESPIVMTNTLSTGTCLKAAQKYMIEKNPDIGVTTGTVNVVVTECNDAKINDIRGQHVTEQDFVDAIESADTVFEEGGVGAGTGMVSFGFKGGIGSSSRRVKIGGKNYTIGAIVLDNFGSTGYLVLGGRYMTETVPPFTEEDKGSCIMLIGTDIPLSERQLKRVANRSAIALGRLGSYSANGSGDIAIAFTTANRIPHTKSDDVLKVRTIHEDCIDDVFKASVEAVEEAIVSALYHGERTTGFNGRTYYGLKELI